MEGKYPHVSEAPPRYEYGNETHFEAATTVVVTPVANILGNVPCMATCPSCGNRGVTTVTYEANTKTHLIALVLCLIGCIFCVCVPYCMDSCQTAMHHCGRCNAFVGSFKN